MLRRDFLVLRPKIGRSARQAEVVRQGDISTDAEDFFDLALSEFHLGGNSRPLDCGPSSTLDARASNLSSTMDTMAERLAYALAQRGMTPPDLIRVTKLSKGTVYFILDGTTKPEKIWASTVKKICRALRIRDKWLLEGRGSMNADSGKSQGKDTPVVSVDDLHELRIGLSLTAKALAASIRPAGRAVLDELEESGEPLVEGSFLGELAQALRAEVGPVKGERPASSAKPSKAHR